MQTTDPIQSNPYSESEQPGETHHHSLENAKQAVASGYSTIRSEASQCCDCAAEQIRKNPIAYVLGAAVLGAAVCYLIMEGRYQPTFRDRFVSRPLANASDKVSDSLGSAFNSLKFW